MIPPTQLCNSRSPHRCEQTRRRRDHIDTHGSCSALPHAPGIPRPIHHVIVVIVVVVIVHRLQRCEGVVGIHLKERPALVPAGAVWVCASGCVSRATYGIRRGSDRIEVVCIGNIGDIWPPTIPGVAINAKRNIRRGDIHGRRYRLPFAGITRVSRIPLRRSRSTIVTARRRRRATPHDSTQGVMPTALLWTCAP